MKNNLKQLLILLPLLVFVIVLVVAFGRFGRQEPATSTVTPRPSPFPSVTPWSVTPRVAVDPAYGEAQTRLMELRRKAIFPKEDKYPLVPPNLSFGLEINR